MKKDGNCLEHIGGVSLNLSYYDGEDHYSEGANEDVLLDYVSRYDESEYEGVILGSRLWSVMYHLSHTRENIVSFLPITKDMSVLEIGAGCGAVTGALSAMAGKVTCIELSKKRSLINATRHKDRDNIEIVVGNFQDIEPELEEKYDVITLIGVLEYAESYIGGTSPYLEMIKCAASHLTEQGRLVIAIENKYGLKYFAGCKEDHAGKFFEGIEGYPESTGVRTFSRGGLEALIAKAFMEARFYYPYPDYKLPHVIYSDKRLPEVHELNRNLNNYDADRVVVFDEERVFDELIRDGLFREFSNSFLVVASKAREDGREADLDEQIPIYAKYSDERHIQYRIATVISEDSSGKRYVYKKPLTQAALAHVEGLYDTYLKLSALYQDVFSVNRCAKVSGGVEFEYLNGMTMEEYLDALSAEGRFEEMLSLIREYERRISLPAKEDFKESEGFRDIFSSAYKGQGKALNVSDVDLIFANILFDRDAALSGLPGDGSYQGGWTILDYEWTYDFAVPVSFIIYRSLFYYLRDREDSGFSAYLKEKGINLYGESGISEEERERIFPSMEQSFQLYLKRGTTSFELLHEVMPVATVSLKDCVEERFFRGNLKNPQVYYSLETREGFIPAHFINVLGE